MRNGRETLASLPQQTVAVWQPGESLPSAVDWLVQRDGSGWRAIAVATALALHGAGLAPDRWPWQAVPAAAAATPWQTVDASELTVGIVVIAAAGAPHGFVTTAALLAHAQRAYAHLAAQHETTLEAANDALCIIDANHRVLGFNRAAERLFGIPAAAILGSSLDDHFDPARLWGTRVIRTGERVRQLVHEPQPGTHVVINALPVVVNGEIVGAVTSEQDVTQFVRLQAVLRETSSRMTYLESEMDRLQQVDDPFRHIAGSSFGRAHLVEWIRKVAPTDATVLIRGESGVGKELVARAVHDASGRRQGPFEVVNCGAIPPALFESELFGYEGGAFTGAGKRGKPGRLELADGGTLFLDEVGDLPPDMQVKLLRVLEDKQLYRLGGTAPIKVDVRFIAATNRDLEAMVAEGEFRADLFYRLRVVTINVPPLRERLEDLPELINLFLQELSVRYRRPIRDIEPTVMQALLQYDWPGNVRELRNVIEQLIALADDGVIRAAYLPRELASGQPTTNPAPRADSRAAAAVAVDAITVPATRPAIVPLQQVAQQAEREAIIAALQATGGNRKEAANRLGVSRPTLYAKMKQLGIAPPRQ